MGTFRFLANGLMYCDSAFSTMDCFSKIDQEDQQIYRICVICIALKIETVLTDDDP